MVMPNKLAHLGNDVIDRVKRRCPIHLGFEPSPETFNGIVLWGIGRQVFEPYPVMLGEKPFDGTAFVNGGIIQDQDEQRVGKALVQLMQKLQKQRGRATRGTLPIEALGTQMQGAKQGGTLALRWGRNFDLLAFATPAALDIGFVGKMGFVDKEHFDGPLCLAHADSGDNFCHPGFFFSALGALRGTVLAKRL
jgi:hypothetical protein